MSPDCFVQASARTAQPLLRYHQWCHIRAGRNKGPKPVLTCVSTLNYQFLAQWACRQHDLVSRSTISNSDYKLEVFVLSRSFSGIVLKSLLTGVEVVFAPLRGRLYDLSVDITRDVLVSDAVLVVSITSWCFHHAIQLPNWIPFCLSPEWRTVCSNIQLKHSLVFNHRCFLLFFWVIPLLNCFLQIQASMTVSQQQGFAPFLLMTSVDCHFRRFLGPKELPEDLPFQDWNLVSVTELHWPIHCSLAAQFPLRNLCQFRSRRLVCSSWVHVCHDGTSVFS